MTPIVNAPEGSVEEHYNKLQCTARNTVERTIGLLKNRWRCTLGHRVLHYDPATAAKIINACCVLHNICNKARLCQDDIDIPIESMGAVQDPQEALIDNPQGPASAELRKGVEARARLAQELWAARHLHPI